MKTIMNYLTTHFGARDISQYPELWYNRGSQGHKVYVCNLESCVYVQPVGREFHSLDLKSI